MSKLSNDYLKYNVEIFIKLNYSYKKAYKIFKLAMPEMSFIRKSTYEGLKRDFLGKGAAPSQVRNVQRFLTKPKRVYPPKVYAFRDKLTYTGLNTYFICTPQYYRYHKDDFAAVRDIYIEWVINNSGLDLEFKADEAEKASISEAATDREDLAPYLKVIVHVPPRLHAFEYSSEADESVKVGYWQYYGVWFDGEWRRLVAPDDFPDAEITEILSSIGMG